MQYSKLEIGVMKSKRRRELISFEDRFKNAISYDQHLSYCDFEKSLELFSLINRSNISEKDLKTGRMSKEDFSKLMNFLSTKVIDEGVYLFLSHYNYIGGINFSLVDFLRLGTCLLDFDRDSAFIVSKKNIKNGILVDFDDNSREEDWGYEIFLWGGWAKKYGHLISNSD